MPVQKKLSFNPFTNNFDYNISTKEINNLLSAIKIITIYEVISFTNTSTGTVNPPTGGTIFEEHYGAGNRVILSEVSAGVPTYITPTSGQTTITGSIDQSGQVSLSQNYIGDIAVFYGVRISNEDYSKLNVSIIDRVIDTIEEQDIINNIYGTQFNLFLDNILSSNSTLTLQDKINANTSSILPNGVYKIKVNYLWNFEITNHDFESYLFVDGNPITINTTGLIHKQEPKDAAGNFMGTGSNQAFSYSHEFVYTVNNATATTNIRLAFRPSINGNIASIWNTSIELIRIQ